jgi:hypothetical protein
MDVSRDMISGHSGTTAPLDVGAMKYFGRLEIFYENNLCFKAAAGSAAKMIRVVVPSDVTLLSHVRDFAGAFRHEVSVGMSRPEASSSRPRLELSK